MLRAHPYLALIALCAALLFAGVDRYSLRGSTEPREAGVAAAMMQDGQYVVPRLNDTPFLEKPPLSYWLQAASMQAFGATPLAARLPSILAAIACVCLMFFTARRLSGADRAAWLAALALLTMASFWTNARTAGQDILLTLGVQLALSGFALARLQPAPRPAWLLYVVGIVVATFSKGVVGLVVPGIVIFAFLLLETFWLERRLTLKNWLLPAAFALPGLLPLAAWLIALAAAAGMDAVRDILWSNSVGRFAGNYQYGAHAEPFYYYLLKLPETFAPWNLLLLCAGWGLWRVRREIARDWRLLFALCWLLAPYALLSFSAGKRPTYLLMIYPAAALLIALGIGHLRARVTLTRALALLYALLMSGGAAFVAVWLWRLQAHGVALALAVVALALLVPLWRARQRGDRPRQIALTLALTAAVYIAYGAGGQPRDQREDSSAEIFAQLSRYEQAGHTLLLYRPIERIEGATRFYLQHALPRADTPEALQASLQQNARALALVAGEELATLPDYRVLERFPAQKNKYAIIALP